MCFAAHLGVVQLPVDGVLGALGPGGGAPVRVELDQAVLLGQRATGQGWEQERARRINAAQ